MEAEIKVTEVLLKQARVLRASRDPAEGIAAAKWEIKLEEELRRLRKSKPAKTGAVAGG